MYLIFNCKNISKFGEYLYLKRNPKLNSKEANNLVKINIKRFKLTIQRCLLKIIAMLKYRFLEYGYIYNNLFKCLY